MMRPFNPLDGFWEAWSGMADAFRRDRFKCRAVAFGATKIFWYIVYLCIVGLMNRSLSIAMGVRVPLLDLFAAYLVASDCVSITGHLQSWACPCRPCCGI